MTTESTARLCPQCQTPLPESIPQGLCANCLAGLGYTKQAATPASEVQLPATAIVTLGMVELISIPISIITAAWLELFTVLVWSLSAAAIGTVTVLTGLSLKRTQNYAATIVGLSLCLIPSVLWLLKLPFIFLAFRAMTRPHVRASFTATPLSESDAWLTFRRYAIDGRKLAGVIGTSIARPVKWLVLNRRLLWSLAFLLGFVFWAAFAFGASTFSVYVDQVALGATQDSPSVSLIAKHVSLAGLPFLLGATVIARHCLRRFRRTEAPQWKEHVTGVCEALIALMVVAVIMAAVSMASASLSHFFASGSSSWSLQRPAAATDSDSVWQRGGLEWIYLGQALCLVVILTLVRWDLFRFLTQLLVITGLIAFPVGTMTLAGAGLLAPFFWSALLPIWLSAPVGGWVLLTLMLRPKSPASA